MFSKGQTVTLRRYKDLCCEYQPTEKGDIDAPYIFCSDLQLYCGLSFKITYIANPLTPDVFYEISLPISLWFSGWRFEDRFFEESNSQRGDDNETN